MLNIYTMGNIPKQFRQIVNVETRYKIIVSESSDRLMNDSFVRYTFREIDNAIQDGDKLITPFGNCYFSECSTGAKAVILAYLYKDTDRIVNITECGENAIALLSLAPYDFNTFMSSCVPLGKSERLVRFNGKEMTLSQANKESLRERIKEQ